MEKSLNNFARLKDKLLIIAIDIEPTSLVKSLGPEKLPRIN